MPYDWRSLEASGLEALEVLIIVGSLIIGGPHILPCGRSPLNSVIEGLIIGGPLRPYKWREASEAL